jgi:hypothetical protein
MFTFLKCISHNYHNTLMTTPEEKARLDELANGPITEEVADLLNKWAASSSSFPERPTASGSARHGNTRKKLRTRKNKLRK